MAWFQKTAFCEFCYFLGLIGHTPWLGVNRLTAEITGLMDRLGSQGRSSLIGWEQALSLGVLQNGIVAEVVLIRGLNAEGPLCSHAPHRLTHIK